MWTAVLLVLHCTVVYSADMEVSTFTCGESTQAAEFHFVSPAYPVRCRHTECEGKS